MKIQMLNLTPSKPKTTLYAVFSDGTRVSMKLNKFSKSYRYSKDSTQSAYPLAYAKERAVEEGAVRFERI